MPIATSPQERIHYKEEEKKKKQELKVKNRVGGGGKQIFQISSYQWS
jgi:hypothetical protein